MTHHRHTIMQDSMEAVMRIQQKFARSRGIPWGISESACSADSGEDYGYHAFGVPELAMKTPDANLMSSRHTLPFWPYASILVPQ